MKPYAEPYIALADCKHGFTYRIKSRNLEYGVFNKDENGFVGIREKFGREYLFTEFHWDTGAPYGTVCPLEAVEECPIKNLNEELGIYCLNCGAVVQWNDKTKWTHAPITDCTKVNDCFDVSPCGRENKELFAYLDALRKKLNAT